MQATEGLILDLCSSNQSSGGDLRREVGDLYKYHNFSPRGIIEGSFYEAMLSHKAGRKRLRL